MAEPLSPFARLLANITAHAKPAKAKGKAAPSAAKPAAKPTPGFAHLRRNDRVGGPAAPEPRERSFADRMKDAQAAARRLTGLD